MYRETTPVPMFKSENAEQPTYQTPLALSNVVTQPPLFLEETMRERPSPSSPTIQKKNQQRAKTKKNTTGIVHDEKEKNVAGKKKHQGGSKSTRQTQESFCVSCVHFVLGSTMSVSLGDRRLRGRLGVRFGSRVVRILSRQACEMEIHQVKCE